MGLTAAAGAAFCAAHALFGQVVLSEFQASNAGALEDEDGDSADWIELFNSGDTPVDLRGWSLTDEAGRFDKWQFPSTNLAAGHFMLCVRV